MLCNQKLIIFSSTICYVIGKDAGRQAGGRTARKQGSKAAEQQGSKSARQQGSKARQQGRAAGKIQLANGRREVNIWQNIY